MEPLVDFEDGRFESIWRVHYRRVYALVYMRLGCCRDRQPREEAREITQEVFLDLAQDLKRRWALGSRPEEDPNGIGYLLRKIAGARLVDHLRLRHLARKNAAQFEAYDESAADGESRPGHRPAARLRGQRINQPEVMVMLKEVLIIIKGCMDALSAKQRTALLLKYGAGLSIGEVARVLGESEKTVQHSILPLAYDKFAGRLSRWLDGTEIDRDGAQRLLERFIESQELLKDPCPSRQDLAGYLRGDGEGPYRTAVMEHLAVCQLCWATITDLSGVEL